MADRMGLLLVVENLSDYRNATVTVQKLNDDVAKSMVAVEGTSEKASVGVGDMAKAFALGNIAAAALQKGLGMVVKFGKGLIVQSTMLAARVDVLGTVLQQVGNNAGYTAAQIAELEENVKEQGITTSKARQSLIMMAQANVDWAYATDLARVAQNAAVIAGINSSDAFERLIYAVSRGRTEIMETLGVITNFVKAEEDMAAELGKSRKELTQAEKMQARFNETMRAASAISGAYESAMSKAGKQMTSIPRYVEEIQLAIGEAFQPAYTELIFGIKEVLGEVLEVVQENKDELMDFGKALGDLVTELLDLKGELPTEDLGEFLETLTTLVRMLQVGIESVREFKEEHRALMDVFKALNTVATWPVQLAKKGLGPLVSKMNEARKDFELLTEYEEQQAAIADELAGKTGDLADEMSSLKAANREAAKSEEELADAQMVTIELTEEQKKAAEELAEMRLDIQRDLADRLIEQERDAIKKSIELQREREDIAKRYAQSVADAYADADRQRAELAEDEGDRLVEMEEEASQQIVEVERESTKRRAEFDRKAAADREKIDTAYSRKRIDIETNTRQKLQDIQRDFEMSVQDAARTRDAFALVQAQRKAQQERETALRSRDEQIADAKTARDRQRSDLEKSLAEEKLQLEESLAERRVMIQENLAQQQADYQESLAEKQAAIEEQLQEALAAAEAERQADLDAQALQLEREREMEALQAQWEEEDRQRRLARQLEDMERQYGNLEGVTAESLTKQAEEWAETYGPEGAATEIVTTFSEIVQQQMDDMREAMVGMANEWTEVMQQFAQTPMISPIILPEELQFQSPDLGITKGIKDLQKHLKSQPLEIFGGGYAPAAPSASRSFSRQETFSKSEHSIDMNMPANIDAVIAKQLSSVLRQSLVGVQ